MIWINMNWSYIWNTFWPKCAPASSFEIINDSVERSHLEKRLSAELISTIIYQEMKPTLSACNSNRFSTLATVHIHTCILRRSHLGQSASQGFRFTIYNNSLVSMDRHTQISLHCKYIRCKNYSFLLCPVSRCTFAVFFTLYHCSNYSGKM